MTPGCAWCAWLAEQAKLAPLDQHQGPRSKALVRGLYAELTSPAYAAYRRARLDDIAERAAASEHCPEHSTAARAEQARKLQARADANRAATLAAEARRG